MGSSSDAQAKFRQSAEILKRLFDEVPYTNANFSGYNYLSNNFRFAEPKMATSALIFKDAKEEEIASVIIDHPPSGFSANYLNVALALREYPAIADKWRCVDINHGGILARDSFEKAQKEIGLPSAMTDEEIPEYLNNMRLAHDSGKRAEAAALDQDFANRFLVAHHIIRMKAAAPL